jgi:outer membrane protein OmpU
MNMKKIGLTALAASLVSVSANAGEMSISGAASIGVNGYSGEKVNMGKSFTMGNQVTISGGGELDNGMTVSLSFELDHSDSMDPFDNQSITVSSEEMGTLTIAGHGGASAASSIDTSAAGDIWGSFDGLNAFVGTGVTGAALKDSSPGNNSVFYTLPSIMDGVSLFASYNPSEAATNESEIGYGITYTGIEGLSVSYATTDINSGATASSGEQTSWKASYAYGPVTVGASNSDHDVATTASSDTELSSYNIAYTVSDELSVAYGVEELSVGGTTNDAEYSQITIAYTSGGMTLTAKLKEGENVDNSNNSQADQEYYYLGAAFAF